MKTKPYKIFAFALVIAILLALGSCNLFAPGNGDKSGEMTLVVLGSSAKEYKVDLEKVEITKGLVSVLDYLKENEGLTYEMSGTFINDVNGLMNGAPDGAYISLYTTVSKDTDVSQYATAIEYNGKALTSTGVGALDMHIEDGALIVIKLAVWEE